MSRALRTPRRSLTFLAVVAILASLITAFQAAVLPVPHASAALPATLTATKVGWNVVGLDSNRVTIGPNQFPNGVRLCNTSLTDDTTGTATWTWTDNTHATYIYLANPATLSYTVAKNSCMSLYWTVEIKRDSASYFKTRNFEISVTPTGATPTTVSTNQQIYVEKLVSQNRNTVGSITGPGVNGDNTKVEVGNTYTYTLTGATAPGGYEQVEFAAIFDPTLFEILEVSQNYAANTASAALVPTPNPQMYANACNWDSNPTSPTYRSCLGVGKAGGSMTATFRVRIKAAGTSRINTLIYDYSGSSYHYNSDYGFGPSITTTKAALSVTKTSPTSTYNADGVVIAFTISATNTGDDTITNVTIDDTVSRPDGSTSSVTINLASCTWPNADDSSIRPGQTLSCPASYTTLVADTTSGSFTNTAVVRGTANGTPVSGSGSKTLVYQQDVNVKITVTKVATPNPFTIDDTRIYYTFTVKSTNNGSADVQLFDAQVDGWIGTDCSIKQNNINGGTMTGAGFICQAYHTITPADRALGYINNTVTATVNQNGKTNSASASASVIYGGLTASISLDKTANPTTYGDDSVITYTFAVANTGDDTVTGLAIDDTQLDAPATCAKTTLVGGLTPDDSTVCTGVKTFTLADVNTGSLTNTATAKALSSRGNLVTATDSATVTAIPASPSLTVGKTSPVSRFTGVGDIIPYQFTVTNTGNVTINNVTIDDTQLDSPGATCQAVTLAPQQTTTCVGQHTVVASDDTVVGITNTARATGNSARNNAVVNSPTVNLTVPYVFSKITVTKIPLDDTVAGAGSVASFSVRVRNTGNETLTNVTVDDTVLRTPPPNTAVPVACSRALPATLTVDDSFTCTVNYTFTQADVNAGLLNNSVTASGKDPGNVTVDDSAIAQVLAPAPSPRLTIDKTSPTDSYSAVDDTVNYVYTLRNTGNVTLTNVAVDDTMVSPQPIPCVATTLAPGQSTTCEAYYKITNADLSKQWLANTASATASPPNGAPITAPPSTAYVPKVAAPQLQVTKSVNPTSFTATDDTRTYTVTVKNVGPGDLSALTLDDPLFQGAAPFGGLNCGGADDTLTVNETMTCTAIYTVTQADMNRGYVNNTVTAIALKNTGQPVIDRASVTMTGPVNVTTGITVVKSTGATSFTTAGQIVPFSFVVTNTGNVTLSNVVVLDGSLNTPGATCPGTTLAPAASMTCTGNYTVTAGDVTNGKVINTASATGTPTRGTPPTATPSTVTVPKLSATPNMTVTKTQAAATYSGSGQTLSYSIVITNTGDDTLNAVTLDDTVTRTAGTALGLSGTCAPIALPGTLSPAQATTCTASYTTTAGESVGGGSVTNTATVTATPASGGSLTRTSAVTATYTAPGPGPGPGPSPNPQLSVTKSVSPTWFAKAGDSLTYTVVVTNTGDVTLTGVSVNDPKVALTCAPLAPASLAVGARMTCTGSYTVTAADVAAGKVDNTATATGTPPSGPPVTGTGKTTATLTPLGDLTVTKTASPGTFSKAGDRITYTVIATNTGSATLTDVRVSDPKVALTCTPSTPATLAPGATITCTGTYTITQADVDAGSVTNTASASGKDPSGKTTTGSDTKRITTPSEGKISVTKSASPSSFAKAGDRINYTVVASNSGDVTLTGVTVDDPKVTLTCSPTTPATLAPGAKVTCTGTYTVTQDDVDTGYVTNSATASGTDPAGRPTTGAADKTVPGKPSPGLEVTKSASPTTFAKVGDSIRYTVVATNTGDATLKNVLVTDPKVALTCSPTTPATLAPGAKVTCTGTYTVTQDDIDNGKATNTATASGKDPSGKEVIGRGGVQVPGPKAVPSLVVSKSAAPTTFGAVGDRISYTVIATNNGNVTLSAVTVTDPLVDLQCAPATPASLAPGATITCKGTYRVTQADMDRGAITNTATAGGTDPGGTPISGTGSTQVPALAADPRLDFTKSASVTTATAVGELVTYTLTVANAGNVTVRSISVSDPLLSPGPTCKASSLAPGETTTCTGTYAVTQADLNRGSITNTATATGTPARGTLKPITATVTIAAEEAWIKAREAREETRGTTRVTISDVQESPNLTDRRTSVKCIPQGTSPRGDFSYCTWRYVDGRLVITTAGRPVKIKVTIRARLRDDPNTWVSWTKTVKTRS